MKNPENTIKILSISKDFLFGDLHHESWQPAEKILTNCYWSGESAHEGRHFFTQMLWSPNALYIRFEANQTEPLIFDFPPTLHEKKLGLWNKDVCEIFIAPNLAEPNRYFEFEVSPLGEWVDLEILQLPEKRETNDKYRSGMKVATKTEFQKILMVIKIEWSAFGKTPQTGDVWRGNLLRCVGEGETRGYLAWQPTLTEKPNFHVPEKFGYFEFV